MWLGYWCLVCAKEDCNLVCNKCLIVVCIILLLFFSSGTVPRYTFKVMSIMHRRISLFLICCDWLLIVPKSQRLLDFLTRFFLLWGQKVEQASVRHPLKPYTFDPIDVMKKSRVRDSRKCKI